MLYQPFLTVGEKQKEGCKIHRKEINKIKEIIIKRKKGRKEETKKSKGERDFSVHCYIQTRHLIKIIVWEKEQVTRMALTSITHPIIVNIRCQSESSLLTLD